MPRLGAHLSAAGGVSRAVSAAVAIGCEALQVFLRAPGRWAAAPLAQSEVARFRSAVRKAALSGLCFAHAPYLLNLASTDDELRTRSIAVLVEELGRAGRLGLAGVVLHPGSAGEGSRPEAELARLVEPRLRRKGRRAKVGTCLDSAHLWGAGYDLLGDGWERVLAEVGEHWGIAVPHLLHGNDTRVELGSHRDRHAAPGEGRLGRRFFRRLLADPRCASLPVVLEIPPGEGNKAVRASLRRLRSWGPG
jgi:deoxyribonuclease-4